MSVLEIDFFTAVRAIPLLIEENAIDPANFYDNIVLQYVFVLLGAVLTISKCLRGNRASDVTHKLGLQG